MEGTGLTLRVGTRCEDRARTECEDAVLLSPADIQKVAAEAIEAINGIGVIIGEVNEVATAIAAAVEEQGAATQEISRNTQYAAQGTRNVSENIAGVKTDADAAATAAEKVRHASETLETQNLQLSNQVTEFLTKIRAA
jgi:methyl-accepting chemotaxis protein